MFSPLSLDIHRPASKPHRERGGPFAVRRISGAVPAWQSLVSRRQAPLSRGRHRHTPPIFVKHRPSWPPRVAGSHRFAPSPPKLVANHRTENAFSPKIDARRGARPPLGMENRRRSGFPRKLDDYRRKCMFLTSGERVFPVENAPIPRRSAECAESTRTRPPKNAVSTFYFRKIQGFC